MKPLLLSLILFFPGKGSQTQAQLSAYDLSVMADNPIVYWNDGSGRDLCAHHRDAMIVRDPLVTSMPNGDHVLQFNGLDQYMEVSSDLVLSVPATGVLAIEAWLRPDTLDFLQSEGSGYVYWLGKGATGQHEYATRMYGQHPSGHDWNRPNRVSGYVFNPNGGLGAGSYYQAPSNWIVKKGEWMLCVLIINTSKAAISSVYPTGYTKLYLLRANQNNLVINKDQDGLINYNIVPAAGSAPLRVGTRNFTSFFKGAIGKIALYNYEIALDEIAKHARKMFDIK